MNDNKLTRQYKSDTHNIAVHRKSTEPYKISPSSKINRQFKLMSKHVNPTPDFSLSLHQLQYTKSRKYKHNLNPLFEQISTTPYRYDHNKTVPICQSNIESQKYAALPVNDRSSQNDRSFQNDISFQNDRSLEDNRKKGNQDRIKQYKERSEAIKQNINIKQKSNIYSFGQLFYPVQNDFSSSNRRNSTKINSLAQKNVIKTERQNKQPQNSTNKTQNNDNLGIEKEYFTVKQTQASFQDTSLGYKKMRQQLAQKYIQETFQGVEQMKIASKQNDQKLLLLRREVEMYKQKNLLKEKQLYYSRKQRFNLQKKALSLKSQLKYHSSLYVSIEQKHHKCHKIMRQNKEELKKQEKWLKQENIQIKIIEQKYQQLIQMMENLSEEEDKKQAFWGQLQKENQLNSELKDYIGQLDAKIQNLKYQNKLIQEETQTLQTHQQQLISLQQKFKRETQVLVQSYEDLAKQLSAQRKFIDQEDQFDHIMKSCQLEIGQLNEKKIFLNQQIEDINIKIGVKKRNIRHIEKTQFSLSKKKQPYTSESGQYQKNHYEQQKSFVRSRPKSHSQKIPLSTIREQSKNTSTQQSPKRQMSRQPQQSYHPFKESYLQIDSRQVSRTEILKPYKQSPNKLKKYFVVESQDERMSNMKSSYCFQERNSDQMFIQRGQKPSIEHRLIELQQIIKRTQEDDKIHYNYVQVLSPNQEQRHFQGRRQKSAKQQMSSQLQQSIKSRKSRYNEEKHGSRLNESQKSSNIQSQQVFESLIQRYEQIKSNSLFDQQWKERI